MKFWNYK